MPYIQFDADHKNEFALAEIDFNRHSKAMSMTVNMPTITPGVIKLNVSDELFEFLTQRGFPLNVV